MSMQIFLALFIVIFASFVWYHLTFRGVRIPKVKHRVYLTGMEFLILGVILGEQFTGLIDESTLKGLEPLSALLLGWIGLLFGFQFEITNILRFPVEFFWMAVLESMVTFVVVGLGMVICLPYFITFSDAALYVSALAVASAAACTAQTRLALIKPDKTPSSRKVLDLLGYISSIDGVAVLLLFGIAFIVKPISAEGAAWAAGAGKDILLNLSAGCGLLLLYLLFLARRASENELIAIIAGMAVLSSGAAAAISFSPLLINFFIGVFLVNFSIEKERIFNILISIEKPIYLLLLVFLGAVLRLNAVTLIVLSLILIVLRFAGKTLGGYAIARFSPRFGYCPSNFGFGLMDFGGLGMAIIFDFHRGFHFEGVSGVVGAVLIAAVVNNMLCHPLMNRMFKAIS